MLKVTMILFLAFFVFHSASAREQNEDMAPPQEREPVKWFSLRTPGPTVSSTALETDDIRKAVLEDYQIRDDPSLPSGVLLYDPVVIYIHGPDEYGFEIGSLRGYAPGFPLRLPEKIQVSFMGKILNREAWHYAVNIFEDSGFNSEGIYYTVMEIQLGSGKACLPLALVVDLRTSQGTR